MGKQEQFDLAPIRNRDCSLCKYNTVSASWTSECPFVTDASDRLTGALTDRQGDYLSLMKTVKASNSAPREIQ